MVRVTGRDMRLIWKCAAAQWLTTSQLQRVFFPEVTLDRVRKRLRKLVEEGYLRSAQPHRMVEMLHTVGSEGKKLLEGKGLEVKLAKKLPEHLEHLVGINDIRIEVESGKVRVEYFFAHWELGRFRWPYSVIPDAAFSVVLNSEGTFMVEYDRGTEDRKGLTQKLRQYESISASFPFHAVIAVAESPNALNRLSGLFNSRHHSFLVLCAGLPELRAEGMFGQVFRKGSRKLSLGEVLEGAERDD